MGALIATRVPLLVNDLERADHFDDPEFLVAFNQWAEVEGSTVDTGVVQAFEATFADGLVCLRFLTESIPAISNAIQARLAHHRPFTLVTTDGQRLLFKPGKLGFGQIDGVVQEVHVDEELMTRLANLVPGTTLDRRFQINVVASIAPVDNERGAKYLELVEDRFWMVFMQHLPLRVRSELAYGRCLAPPVQWLLEGPKVNADLASKALAPHCAPA